MKLEHKNYDYNTLPDFDEPVDSATVIPVTGHETGVTYIPDVVYMQDGGHDLTLQILQPYTYFPEDALYPIVLYVKGSSWKKQDVYKHVAALGKLAEKGYVCAIVEYVSAEEMPFPAQIEQTKNAVRYLKDHALEYHADKDKVILTGGSSGGHTAALAALTADQDLFDRPAGETSAKVQGLITMFGALEITLEQGFPCFAAHSDEDMIQGFPGGEKVHDLIRKGAFNAKTYVSDCDFPVLCVHGTKDILVRCDQSTRFYEALKAAGKQASMILLKGSDHGGPAFWIPEMIDAYDAFIQTCL